MNRTQVQAPLKTLIIVAAVALALTACGGGPTGLEPVPDKSDLLAAASSSGDQGEATFRDESLGMDLVIQVQDKETKGPVSGMDVLVMTSGEDVVFAAMDPEGRYFPAFVTKPRSDLVSPLDDRYVASGAMASPSRAQGTPIVLLMVKTGPIGWQELQIGLGVSDLAQRFGIFEAEYCRTPSELERTGGLPGKFVVVALPPPGVLEGAPVTSFGVLIDQLAEFLTLSGMPDQPFLARAYRLPKVPLWMLEVDGPCTPGGAPVSPPISPFSPFVSPPEESPPSVSPPGPESPPLVSPPGPESPPLSSPPGPESPPLLSPPGPESPPLSSPPGPESPPLSSPPGPESPPSSSLPGPESPPLPPPPPPPPPPSSPPRTTGIPSGRVSPP